MRNLFEEPKAGDMVVLVHRGGHEYLKQIQSVTSRTIRIAGCNLYKFRRNGVMHKTCDREQKIRLTIKPYSVKVVK